MLWNVENFSDVIIDHFLTKKENVALGNEWSRLPPAKELEIIAGMHINCTINIHDCGENYLYSTN